MAAGESEFEIQATDLEWPLGVYSLSHISLPFSPNDPIYGAGSAVTGAQDSLVLGAIAPRGEIGVLRPPPSWFLRTRYNPFFTYQVKLMQDWLRQTQ